MTSVTRIALATLALIGAASLSACDGLPPRGVERTLRAMPGVVEVEVEETNPDEDVALLAVDVVVTDDATAGQVTDLLEAAHDGTDQDAWCSVGVCDVEFAVHREGEGEHGMVLVSWTRETSAEIVRRWTTAEERLSSELSWRVVGDGVVQVETDSDAGSAGVSAAAEQVLADPVLAGLPQWVFSTGDQPGQPDHTLITDRGMTEQILSRWQGATEVAALLPPGAEVVSLSLRPDDAFPSRRGEPVRAGAMEIDVTLSLPGDPAGASVTRRAWGERLWPSLHGYLDVLASMPATSSLTVYVAAEDLLCVTETEIIVPDTLGRGWDTEALDYLAGG